MLGVGVARPGRDFSIKEIPVRRPAVVEISYSFSVVFGQRRDIDYL
jgi:hypothetical protein